MPARGQIKTHCKWGHPLSGENLKVKPSGKRECRECIRERSKRWNEKHREKYLEMHRLRAKNWRLNNPEKSKESQKRWRQTDKAKKAAVERTTLWRKNNPEKFKQQRMEHGRRNVDKIKTWYRNYRTTHAEEISRRRHLEYVRANPGPEFRRIARELREGSLDVDAAIAKIRESFNRFNGTSEGVRGPQRDGDRGISKGSRGDGSDSSESV